MKKNDKKTAPKPGIVYVLTNPALVSPDDNIGLVKIGYADNLRERLKVLNSSSAVPRPFSVYFAVRVEDAKGAEGLLHDAFDDRRDTDSNKRKRKREFFAVAPERVKAALKLTFIRGIEVVEYPDDPDPDTSGKTEDAQTREKRERRRAKNFRFDALGIPEGAVLTFWRNPKLKATVVDGKNTVKFKGKLTTVSGAANAVLGAPHGVNGTYYWEYKGETLDDIRTRKKQKAKTKTRMTRK